MSFWTLTEVHVAASSVSVVCGLTAVGAMVVQKYRRIETGLFLAMILITGVTGLMFHVPSTLLPIVLGIGPIVLVFVAVFALYCRGLGGIWRPTYIATSVLALYEMIFFVISQLFAKLPQMHTFAPTGREPIVFLSQMMTFALFAIISALALLRFRPSFPDPKVPAVG